MAFIFGSFGSFGSMWIHVQPKALFFRQALWGSVSTRLKPMELSFKGSGAIKFGALGGEGPWALDEL